MNQALAGDYQLLEGVLEKGLPYAAAHLERRLNKPVLITDNVGKVHYPDEPGTPSQLDDHFIDVPQELNEGEYYYQEPDGTLYYAVGKHKAKAFVIVKGITGSMLAQAISDIEDASLAIKLYFKNMEKIAQDQADFKKELVEYLLFKSNFNIRDIIKLSQQELDLNKQHIITITETDEGVEEVDWPSICAQTRQHFKRVELEIIPVPYGKCMIGIFPAYFREDTLEVDPDWPRVIYNNSLKFKEIIRNITHKPTSIGIGQVYNLDELHRSYIEARVALTIPRLMGKKHFVQHFSDLGVFSFIFSQSTEAIERYCYKSLGPILEYDRKHDADLLPTLRVLSENGFNRKVTADTMFLHINTVNYRIGKIQNLLDVDLSQIDVRANLYIAIKVWDTLKTLGLKK